MTLFSRTRGILLLGSLLLELFASRIRADDALEIARAGNTSTIQSIHTFSCRITVTQTGVKGVEEPPSYTGEYWRSEDDIRCQYIKGRDTVQSLRKGDRYISWHTGSAGNRKKGVINQASDAIFGDCDVWMLGLLTFAGPDNNLFSFDALLNQPYKIRKVRREPEGSSRLTYVKLELKDQSQSLEFWFDPQFNFMARKHIVNAKNHPAEIRSEFEVTRFQEAAPGIFFPEKVENHNFYGTQPLPSRTIDFQDIRVNQPIPETVFQLHFPAGTQVFDQIRGKVYNVDENGNPAGPMQDLMRSPFGATADVTPRSQTLEEPQPLSRWILPLSATILVSAGLLWLARKWKQTHVSTAAKPK